MDLTPEEIETLNAYGPYNHAVWRGRGVTVSQEEGLTGRAEFLAALVRKVLQRSFTEAEMADMTLADVGCYDGWLLEQLADLPFKRLVGIEPRERNIEKGKAIRHVLGLQSRVEYRTGSIEALGTERFDVVICMGLLHHLECIGDALRSLKAICRRTLVLETQCLSSEHLTPEFVRELEPKDIAYFGKSQLVGLSGHKFESSYYHGSAIRSSIVTIPTISTIEMFLQQLNFTNIEILVPPSSYWKGGSVSRPTKLCCVVADCGDQKDDNRDHFAQVRDYEVGLMNMLLPERTADLLYNRFVGRPSRRPTFAERVIIGYATGPSWLTAPLLKLIARRWPNGFHLEIIKNLRYAPVDKAALELAKVRFAEGDFAGCIKTAKSIIGHINADWRATYRALLLLALANNRIGNESAARRYIDLARISNPDLPPELFDIHNSIFSLKPPG
jgi:hypothetical protein